MTELTINEATLKFREGIGLAVDNLAVDALSCFREVVDTWPDDDLADDALYNVGACLLAMNQYQRAAETFEKLVATYPDATIATTENAGRESGKTAAKAYLGIVSATLGMGDIDAARQACERLEAYPDSVIHPAPGIERTFHDVAWSLLHGALGDDVEDADEVSPSDCQDGDDS